MCTHTQCFEQKLLKILIFLIQFSIFTAEKLTVYIAHANFCNVSLNHTGYPETTNATENNQRK